MHDVSSPKTRDARRSKSIACSSLEAQVLQRDVDVGERHREGACGRAAVAILARQRERGGAIRARRRSRTSRGRRRRARAGRARAARRSGRAPRPSCRTARARRARSGLASDRPRPMKRARSVSHSTAPPSRGPSTPSTWKPTIGASSAARGRRLNRRPALCGSNSRLDEQLAERRVREVVLGLGQHDLRVAGDLDLARLSRRDW